MVDVVVYCENCVADKEVQGERLQRCPVMLRDVRTHVCDRCGGLTVFGLRVVV